MGDKSAIEWTDATWNPWQGCHRVSPGCDHCYMFREKIQYGQEPDVVIRSKQTTFNLPLRLKTPIRVFTCSWSDFFIREADPWRDEAWAIIDRTRHLTYQILTKRIERVASRLPWGAEAPWPHVQIIASVENQEQAGRRIPRLLRLNAAVRGVSYEPALGPVNFSAHGGIDCLDAKGLLDWIIVGGESGPNARPFDLAWARSAIAQCRAAGVPVFVKQLGARPVDGDAGATVKRNGETIWPTLTLRDRKGGDWAEWPEDLRVREFPRANV